MPTDHEEMGRAVTDQLAGYFGWLDTQLSEAPGAAAGAVAAPSLAPRRRIGILAAAVLVVAGTGAVAVVRLSDRAERAPSGPEPTVALPGTEPSSVAPAAAPTSPPPTVAGTSSTTEPATTVPPATVASPALIFGDIAAERSAALASFDSVSFTAQVSESYAGHPDMSTSRSVDVVLLADGTFYAAGDDGMQFNSYDAAMGIARVQWVAPDGTIQYQELVGQSDNSVPLLTMLGGNDPTSSPWGLDEPVEAGAEDGRPVWRMTRDTSGQIEHWTIDRATGFLLGYDLDWPYDATGARAHRTVVITDVQPGAALPPAFPGTPDEAATRISSGDADAFHLMALDEAAAAFGPGFVVPAAWTSGGVHVSVMTSDGPLDADPESPLVTTVVAELTATNGFTRTSMFLFKIRPTTDGVVPSGQIVVDDAMCASTDGVSCVSMGTSGVLDGGELAGEAYEEDGYSVTVDRVGVRVSINAPVEGVALDLANTLVSV